MKSYGPKVETLRGPFFVKIIAGTAKNAQLAVPAIKIILALTSSTGSGNMRAREKLIKYSPFPERACQEAQNFVDTVTKVV